MATRLDEGLEDFFSRRVMDESSRWGAWALSLPQQISWPRKASNGSGPRLTSETSPPSSCPPRRPHHVL